ncbi:hypothetical protein MPUL_49560 [Mycolicibacterium pulveris]|uniref:Uncharacterized protein n=1 Tax=Mycolicibacterium pulveris TaxID=36813 RepID=A0A7I7UQY8_MYCPV|nr:hypothetical protein MPUL_49560 [Mycolicibacterium pulveris]
MQAEDASRHRLGGFRWYVKKVASRQPGPALGNRECPHRLRTVPGRSDKLDIGYCASSSFIDSRIAASRSAAAR